MPVVFDSTTLSWLVLTCTTSILYAVDGYIRVSRVAGRSGESYISPSTQRDAIERWAAYKGTPIAAWHKDEDWSGGTHNRPGLEAAIARCLNGETDGIVAYKIDRFSRYTEAGLRDLRLLEAANARLAFVTEDIDTSGPIGKFVYTIMLAMAEYFLDQIKASWIIAKTRAVERGAKISRAPWGYQRQPDGTLAPHHERAPIVAEAFRLAAGDSLQAAMAYLREVAPERGWNATKVRRLLGQRSYLGEVRYGDLVQTDAHELIVSRAIWEAAQSTPRARKASANFPLSGVIRCETCGAPMVGGRSGRDADRMYRCSASLTASAKDCGRPALVTAEIVERYLRDVTRPLLAMRATVGDPDSDALTLLERAIAEAEAELDAFAGDLTARRALGERYHTHLQARVGAVEKARAAYRERARDMQAELAMSGADIVEDPQLFPLALRSIFDSILIRPGRGLAVDQRVRLVPVDSDGATGKS